jgi:hypothetical protein
MMARRREAGAGMEGNMSWMMKVAGVTAAAALCTGLATAPAKADVYMFGGSGSGSDGSVSATAQITTSVNSLSVTLTDLLANPTSIGQTLSGVIITLATAPTGATLQPGTANLIDFSGATPVTSTGPIDHWGATVSGGDVFLATAGTGSEGGMPTYLIVGPGPYTNANASLGVHSPLIDQTGTFTIDLTGAGTTAPVVTGVQFLFGTGPDTTVPGVPGVPEPATWAMLILGFGMIGAGLRLRRRPALA